MNTNLTETLISENYGITAGAFVGIGDIPACSEKNSGELPDDVSCGCAHDPLPELYAYPPGDPAGSKSYPWTYPYLFSPPLFRENCSNLNMNLGCYRAIEKMHKFPTWYRPNDATIRVVSSRFPRCPDSRGGYFPNGYIWSGASGRDVKQTRGHVELSAGRWCVICSDCTRDKLCGESKNKRESRYRKSSNILRRSQ